MTREEVICHIEDILCENNTIKPNIVVFEQEKEALRIAIKVLKQGDVLDKIRAEIEQAADKQFQIAIGVSDLNERYAHIRMENAYRHSLNVIDKYKAESEG